MLGDETCQCDKIFNLFAIKFCDDVVVFDACLLRGATWLHFRDVSLIG